MAQLAKVKLGETEVWAEVSQTKTTKAQRTLVPAGAGQRVLDATESLNAAIRGYCGSLRRAFQSMEPDVRPMKVNASFGLTLSLDGKFALVEAGVEASLTVEAEWELK